MIAIDIPGYRSLHLDHLVLDYNGTIAVDGQLVSGVREALVSIVPKLKIHVLTADTFGGVAGHLAGVDCKLSVLPQGRQDTGKLEYVKGLGCEQAACIGNGRNDRLMLKAAGLGIAVILREGACVQTLMAADIVATDIVAALELLIHPLRLTATLRS